MTNTLKSKILLIAGAVINTVPRYLDFYSADTLDVNEKLYFGGQALSLLLILLAGYFKPHNDKPLSILFELCIWLAISNFMDEVLFDPVHFGLNEIAFALIIISHAVFQYRTYNKSKKIDNA